MIIILITLVLVSSIYLFYRNDMVYSYLSDLNHRCAEACRIYLLSSAYTEAEFIKKRELYDSIMERLDYSKLLFSFKKLKDENLLTKEELDFLKNHESLY